MKARLEFNLPDEHAEFMAAVHSDTTKLAVEDLRDKIRARLKHGPEPDNDFVEEIYRELLEIVPFA